MVDLAQHIKITYEQVGFAVLDVHQIPETPFYEMEFVSPEGLMKKKVMTFFAIVQEDNTCNPL